MAVSGVYFRGGSAACALAALAMLSNPSAAQQSLVTNGSFEFPDFCCPNLRDLCDGSTFVTGWTVTQNSPGGDCSYVARAPEYAAFDGSAYIGVADGDSISTSVSVTGGLPHLLTFYSAEARSVLDEPRGLPFSALRVTASGLDRVIDTWLDGIDSGVPERNSTGPAFNWRRFDIVFSPSSSGPTTLTFLNVNDDLPRGAILLDGVSLRQTCIDIGEQPAGQMACPGAARPFAVTAVGTEPFTYEWQLEVAAGDWRTLGDDPISLPCGGSASAFAQPSDAPATNISVSGCTGDFGVRCIVGNLCGSVTSAAATLHVQRGPRADLNCDGVVNNFDIDPFVLVLTDPAAYSAIYPDCDASNADINCDGRTNNFDIDPFVACLIAAGCP